MCPYIALSQVQARRILWPVITKLNDDYRWGLDLDHQELVARLPNGSSIILVGGDNLRKVESLRGAPYPRIVVDEAASFPESLLRYLIDDVLDAATLDYDGDIWLVGTPNAACVGYFHDITEGGNPDVARVPTYHWTVLDNPSQPHAKGWLERKKEAKGWTEDHPTYQREYMGRWVRDESQLVFRFGARHLVNVIPETHAGVLGVDLGSSAKERTQAYVANLWRKYDRTIYTAYAKRFGGLTPTTGGDKIRELKGRYPLDVAVVDAGGLGGGYIREWQMREDLGIGIEEAEKKDRLAFVEFVNDELDADRIKVLDVPETVDLRDELRILQWDEKRNDFDPRFIDHTTDAWLYSSRKCFSWSEGVAPTVIADPIEKAQFEAKEAAIFESMRRAKRDWRARVR